jgi:hypothetical protein
MGLLDSFRFGRRHADPRFVGSWHLTRCEGALDVHHGIELDFRDDGVLLYSVNTGSTWQIAQLTWRIDSGVLVTDQPSTPAESRTSFLLAPDGVLMLQDADSRSWYERGPKRAPYP